ncbi:hypothetical protein [Streptomyces sp. NPDC020965]|uniref:hypothetical protein n=1 Tax=Streptomyces sp. NPDC020965 TaxID=3365105 RepID=UPI0037A6A11C
MNHVRPEPSWGHTHTESRRRRTDREPSWGLIRPRTHHTRPEPSWGQIPGEPSWGA